jgi:hypothetical protein
MAIWSWLNNNQETLMNKDQVKGRVEEAKGKVKGSVAKIYKGQAALICGRNYPANAINCL